MARLRSRYTDNNRPISAKQMDRLAKTMGPLDSDLHATGFGLKPEFYLRALRSAKNEPVPTQIPLPRFGHMLRLLLSGAPWSDIAEAALPLFTGLFMVGSDDRGSVDGSDFVEGIIRQSSESDFMESLFLFRFALVVLQRGISVMRFFRVSRSNNWHAICLKLYALRNDRRWTSVLLVIAIAVNDRINKLNLANSNLINSDFAAKLASPSVKWIFLHCARATGFQLQPIKPAS